MNVIGMDVERAKKSGDCRDWSPIEALRETIRQAEAGEIEIDMIYIAMALKPNSGNRFQVYQCAGGSKLELMGLLSRHLQITGDS